MYCISNINSLCLVNDISHLVFFFVKISHLVWVNTNNGFWGQVSPLPLTEQSNYNKVVSY